SASDAAPRRHRSRQVRGDRRERSDDAAIHQAGRKARSSGERAGVRGQSRRLRLAMNERGAPTVTWRSGSADRGTSSKSEVYTNSPSYHLASNRFSPSSPSSSGP